MFELIQKYLPSHWFLIFIALNGFVTKGRSIDLAIWLYFISLYTCWKWIACCNPVTAGSDHLSNRFSFVRFLHEADDKKDQLYLISFPHQSLFLLDTVVDIYLKRENVNNVINFSLFILELNKLWSLFDYL